jgi:invasion protein IalB
MKNTTRVVALALTTGLAGAAAWADDAKPNTDQAFGDWTLHCAQPKDGEPVCALRQKIMSSDTKLPVAAFAIARNKTSHELRLAVVLPLGLDIPAGVSGKAGAAPLTFAIQTCVRRGCIASTQVDDKLLESLHAAQALTTTFKMRIVTDPTTLTVSLKGLDDGLKALEAK